MGLLKVPLNHAILMQETGMIGEERNVCLVTLKSLLEINKRKKLIPIIKGFKQINALEPEIEKANR